MAAVAAIAIGVVGMSAFEAHIINVTAMIENALDVNTNPIDFGTVFPQEQLDAEFNIALSESFLAEENADDVNYKIKQKPKCRLIDPERTDLPEFGRVTEDGQGNFVCEDDVNYEMLPILCPFLSKHDGDPDDGNDEEMDAFHGPADLNDWNDEVSEEFAVAGRLAKSQNDETDNWIVDLKVPCFEGQCAQDWTDYVRGINPEVINPDDYVLPTEAEHKLFGCDLWVEVTEISRIPDTPAEWLVLSLENKDDQYWFVETDDMHGVLQYKDSGETFDWQLTVNGMEPSTEYKLVYAPDPWPQSLPTNPNLMIASFTTDASGDWSGAGNTEMNMDFPDSADANFPTGAKIWVVVGAHHDGTQMTAWEHTRYLFEYNLITYNDTGV